MLWLADSLFGPRYEREFARARTARAEAFSWVFTGVGCAIKAVFRSVAVLGKKYRRRQLFQATIRELGTMDEHLLRDIGVTRGDIPTVAAGLVYGKPKTHTADQLSGRRRIEETTSSQDADRRRAKNEWRHAA